MLWLNILDSQVIHIIAETGAIVIGSILMGILFAYLHWGPYKKQTVQLNNKLDFERNQIADLNLQLNELSDIRTTLLNEMADDRNKYNHQSKTIYEQGQQLQNYESLLRENQKMIDQLNEKIHSYEYRLQIIENELTPVKENAETHFITNPVHVTRANYEHVSNLLGKQVTENDLTLIAGIGPRTSFLLQSAGIDTWDKLAGTPLQKLQQILSDAGGMYKSQDPTHWAKQASMAAQSEWRKLRVFQETLKKI